MKRTETGKPYLSVCLIVRNAESPLVTLPNGTKLPALEACLQSVRARAPQAEIVIVHTGGSIDRTEEIALKYADVYEVTTGPRGTWDKDMYAFDDAAWARQRSFDLASGRWKQWIDHDDRLVDPDEAEKLLKLNGRWRPTEGQVTNGPELASLEDVLRFVEAEMPKVDAIWCPYLYQRDDKGVAITWQSRERIIRWDDPPKYHWKEKAHEVLVPIEGHLAGRLDLAHLLYVHEKDFSAEAMEYNLRRHYAINLDQWSKGDVTARRAMYLAGGSKLCDPQREIEFLQLAHDVANTPLDRYRALMGAGDAYAERGLWSDALEALGAATHVRPDLPDAWFSGGCKWMDIGDYARAIEWLGRGVSLPYNTIESFTRPRDAKVMFSGLLATAYAKYAEHMTKNGLNAQCLDALTRACEIWERVVADDATGEDIGEAKTRLAKARNDEKAQEWAMAVVNMHRYLRDNDEPLKATKLAQAIPWNLKDHPLIVGLEAQDRPILRQASGDDAAYFEFYATATGSGFIPTPENWLDLDSGNLQPRVYWIADWINRTMPNARVLDVGCYDGIVGIPLLKLCPNIRYLGVEGFGEAATRFKARVEACGFGDRAEVINARRYTDVPTKSTFDVVLFTEVIEHVADPASELRRHIAPYLKDGGRLFITTPWGSWDHGQPPEKTLLGSPRDNRGHLRVVSPQDLATWGDQEDLLVEDALHDGSDLGPYDWAKGQALRVVLRRTRIPGQIVRFAVPGALWDWNSRIVHAQGMGASEKTIVYLGKELAKTSRVEVYGPTPEPDVHYRVRYWPKEQIRHVKWVPGRDSPIVVSRSPTYGAFLHNGWLPDVPLILWLQDVWYPDLAANAHHFKDVVVVSEWHKQRMHEAHGVPLAKLHVLYNFLLPEHFTGEGPERKRDRFVYASSPDRGLGRIMELWPKILERLPDADLHVFYGWRGCEKLGTISSDASWNQRYRNARGTVEKLKWQKNVHFHGMVNPVELATWFRSAGVWAYPSGDRQNGDFLETGCSVASEVRAAGCVPVCPPRAALAETAKCEQGFFVDHVDEDDFIRCCVEATRVSEDKRQKMSQEAIETYSLLRFLGKWRELLRS